MTVSTIHTGPIVDAPTPAAHTYGLLDVADVREGVAWISPTDMFTSWNCIDSHETTICLPDATPAKTFDAPTVVDGAQFVGYLGGECKPLGFGVEENISRVFDLRESRLVEKRFEATVLGPLSTDLGASTSAAHALAMMENALGDQYAGVGTIHMSPFQATMLFADQLLVEEGGRLYTRLGTKVVVGTGYASTAMYGTGDVVVFRSAKEVNPAPDTANNVQRVLAERVYVVVADCVSLRINGIPAPAVTP